MKQEFFVNVPKPCHENWDNMNPTQQGRFCNSCAKQVIDFSVMSDVEILSYFNKIDDKTCGRFSSNQLLRPLQETKLEKKKGWQWLVATLTSLFVISKAQSQTCNAIMGKMKPSTNYDTTVPIRTIGDTILTTTLKQNFNNVILHGKVTNEKGEPIPYASILVKRTTNGTAADDKGEFMLTVKTNQKFIALTISSVGYQMKQVNIQAADIQNTLNQKLTTEKLKLVYDISIPALQIFNTRLSGELVVFTGLTVTNKRQKKKKSTNSLITKIFQSQKIKVYPNPIAKQEILNIEVPEIATYIIAIYNQQSKMLHLEEVTVEAKKQVVQIQLPSSIINGFYYVRVINKKTNQRSTEKVIVK